MDIYSFIYSKEVADHYRAIGREFTPIEYAVIVYWSDKSLAKQHEAWQWIIDNLPDMEIPKLSHKSDPQCCNSLHQLLREYMEYKNCLSAKMSYRTPNALYDCEGGEKLHHHFDTVLDIIKESGENGEVIKYYPNGEEYYATITPQGEVIAVSDEMYGDEESTAELPRHFTELARSHYLLFRIVGEDEVN
jgi:hypothetical protein